MCDFVVFLFLIRSSILAMCDVMGATNVHLFSTFTQARMGGEEADSDGDGDG